MKIRTDDVLKLCYFMMPKLLTNILC